LDFSWLIGRVVLVPKERKSLRECRWVLFWNSAGDVSAPEEAEREFFFFNFTRFKKDITLAPHLDCHRNDLSQRMKGLGSVTNVQDFLQGETHSLLFIKFIISFLIPSSAWLENKKNSVFCST